MEGQASHQNIEEFCYIQTLSPPFCILFNVLFTVLGTIYASRLQVRFISKKSTKPSFYIAKQKSNYMLFLFLFLAFLSQSERAITCYFIPLPCFLYRKAKKHLHAILFLFLAFYIAKRKSIYMLFLFLFIAFYIAKRKSNYMLFYSSSSLSISQSKKAITCYFYSSSSLLNCKVKSNYSTCYFIPLPRFFLVKCVKGPYALLYVAV